MLEQKKGRLSSYIIIIIKKKDMNLEENKK